MKRINAHNTTKNENTLEANSDENIFVVIRLRGQLKKCRVKNVFTLSLVKVCTKIIFEDQPSSIIKKGRMKQIIYVTFLV